MRHPEQLGQGNELQEWRIHLVVIQPSPFCNIDCKYCYLPDRFAVHRMTPETLEQACRFLLYQPNWLSNPLTIAWHAGEPLAVPIEFYNRAFELFNSYAPPSLSIENWIQSNATLINQDWCDFIKRWNVKIGISVDGPEWIHDLNRVDRSGRGTFKKVLRGIELLKSNNIEFATVGVLSEKALDFPNEIWRFYRELGVESLGFNFEEVEGVHLTSSLQTPACLPRSRAFFERLLELRNREAPNVFIREIDYFLEGIPQWRGDFRRMENVPLGIVAIAWNGNISTFSPELIGMKDARYDDFVFGNVATSTVGSLMTNPKLRAVAAVIDAGVERCRSNCEYFCVCGGGQPSNKLYQNGSFDSDETLACKLRIKVPADVVLDFLEQKYGFAAPAEQRVSRRIENLLPIVIPVKPPVRTGQETKQPV